MEWEVHKSRGRKQPGPIYTNEITCDSLHGKADVTFLVNVPRGNYFIYTLSGLSAGSRYEYHQFDIAAGSRKETIKIPGPYRFEKRLLRTRATGRKPLQIKFSPKTDWIATSLIIIPAKELKKAREEFLDALEKEIEFLPPEIAKKWTEVKHVDDFPKPRYSSTDKKRGFAIFAKQYTELIYPNTVPRAHQLNPELQIFGSPGEYEPATFTVHPFEQLKNMRVAVSDLKSGSSKIPASAINIRYVRYMLARPNYSLYNSYYEVPDVLEEHKTIDVTAGRNQRVWLTVKIPDDAKPGIYEGRALVSASKGKSAIVPFKLRVLPIKLQKDPKYIFGTYYYDPLSAIHKRSTPLASKYFRQKAEWERQDMIEHGLQTYVSNIRGINRDEKGNWTIDVGANEKHFSVDRKYGLFDKPLVIHIPVGYYYRKLVDKRGQGSHLMLVEKDVPESFFNEITKMVEMIEAERKKQGWPEFLYYPVDEPGKREESIAYMVNVLKAVRKVPGVRTYVTANPAHDAFKPMWGHVDVWCYQSFVYSREELAKIQKEKNVEIWSYPNYVAGENDHTPIRGARMTYGFGIWRSGYKVLLPWIYTSSTGDPWNYLDSPTMDFFNRSTPEGKPIPVAMWEAYREGIDDGRYIYTLEQTIKKAKEKGGRAGELAEAAAKDLQSISNAIYVQDRYKYDNLWAGKDFDAYRWLVASHILKLQDAMK